MSTITQPRRSVQPRSRPLTVVEMVITINGTSYAVEPIGNAPGGIKSFRLAKCSGDGATYDLDAFPDRVECSCPSYRKTHEGTSSLCKHGRALVMVGLVDYPGFATSHDQPTPLDAYNTAREKLAAIEQAEATVRVEAEAAPVAPAFDLGWHPAMNAVVKKRAEWLTSRPVEARHVAPAPACCPDDEPMPCQACVTHDGPADLSDETWADGWRHELGPDETDPGTDDEVRQLIADGAYEQAEGEGPLEFADAECFRAVSEGRAEFAREAGLVPYIDWVSRENAADLMADDAIMEGWACHREKDREDGRQLAMISPADPTLGFDLADQLDDVADAYRSNGTAFGAFLAKHLGILSERIRFLGATTPDQFEDRLQALMDGVRDEAEARMASRCC